MGRGAPWAAPLPWLVGPRAAAEILLTGEPVSAARAYEIGLVNRVVPAAELHERTQALAERIAANAPLSVSAAERTVYLSAPAAEADEIWAPVYRSARRTRGAACLPGEAAPRLEGTLMPVSMPGLADDLAEESAVLRALLVPLDEAGLAAADAGGGLVGARPGDPPRVVRRGRGALGPLAGGVRGRAGAPGPRRGGRRVPRPVGRRRAVLVRRRPVPAAHGVPRARPVAAGALVRAADERGVGAHRADHGDVGARPGRRRHRSAWSGSRRPGCATSRTSGSVRGRTAMSSTGGSCPTTPIRVELAAPDGATWTWGPRTPSTGSRARAGLLPARHPAPPPRGHRAGGDRRRSRPSG